jgi:hypothetical protein
MLSFVSVELTNHVLERKGWSETFFPTLGRLTSGVMPRAVRAAGSPIPEFKRMAGVPTVPAERIISFLAVTFVVGASSQFVTLLATCTQTG